MILLYGTVYHGGEYSMIMTQEEHIFIMVRTVIENISQLGVTEHKHTRWKWYWKSMSDTLSEQYISNYN